MSRVTPSVAPRQVWERPFARDGCRQELHADVPHGPWAFVLSLTNWDERRFTGGETFILKPETLDYWRGFDASAVVERGSLVDTVPPLFNRLTVFDPRLPHGVSAVHGTRDPREGRLVLHGEEVVTTPHRFPARVLYIAARITFRVPGAVRWDVGSMEHFLAARLLRRRLSRRRTPF